MSVFQTSIKNLILDIISRKFIVFVLATVFFYIGKINSETWLYIALGYMTANVLESTINNVFPGKMP